MHERGNVTSDPGFATAIQHPPRHPQLLRGQGLVAAGSGQHLFDDPILQICLLYTSDAADERSSVDLGGRRIIKKKKTNSSRREAKS